MFKLVKQILGDMEDFYKLNLNFSWSPANTKNNAILGIVGSFEYRVDSPTETQWNLDFYLQVSDFQFYGSERQKPLDTHQEWRLTSFKVIKKSN